ncbi:MULTISPECIES: phage holin family protein [unclassified Serratia (in: enterobacteria)]|uniref:phage holin family protein n=1 Tax=unclassified Serratia (in: enterobacteria) TaxID=2647522 RepID=UPI00068F2151|nr:MULTISPECIES: phage holin family protein [unclassified Serratia (in: enterobacteria)]
MKMPDKDPGWLAAVAAFYYNYATPINGFLVAFIVAFRRVVWGGGKIRAGIGEALVCGIVGVSISPAIAPVIIFLVHSIPWLSGSMATIAAGKVEIAVSCMIGMFGLSAIKEFVLRVANTKLGPASEKKDQNNPTQE